MDFSFDNLKWLFDPEGAAIDSIRQKIVFYAGQLQCKTSAIKATIYAKDNSGSFGFALYNGKNYVREISTGELLDNPELTETVNNSVQEKILHYAKQISCEPVYIRATIFCVDKDDESKGKFRFCLFNDKTFVRDIKIRELLPAD